MRKYPFLLIVAALLCALRMEGQWELNRNPYIPVTEGDLTFDLAWAGGLNSPQWSQADLDLNGTLDLFAFDRIGDRAMVLLNSQLPGSNPQYTQDVSLLEAFPEMSEWALLKDMTATARKTCSPRPATA